MGTAAPTPDNVAELLQNLQVDPQSGMRESIEVQQNANTGTQDACVDSSGAGSTDGANIATAYGSMDGGMYYAFNGYPPQHGYYIGGYDYPLAEWDDYSRHGKTENAEGQNRGAYNDGGPLVYHPSGYAYNPQHLIMPYTSGAPVRGEGQLYGAQGFSYAGHVYQQSVPNNVPFIPTSASPRMESGVANSMDGSAERTAAGSAANTNSANSGSRMGFVGYQSGFYGRGILPVNVPTSAPPDVRVGAPRSDLPKVADVVPQQHRLPALNSNAQNIRPLAPLMPPIPSGQQHRPRIGVTSTTGAVGRAFQPPGRMYPSSANSARITAPNVWDPRGTYRQWYAFDKGKGRGNGVLGNGGPSWDVLNEQNKGPRTTRSRYQRTNPGAVRYVRAQGSANGMPDTLSLAMNKDQYNRPDFVTKYENAKFFIIKSYSEDDIHKSIKYNVWASTANGNKKLDAAYQEVQSCPVPYPVFLLFSVNASGQFCGVAEMTGPVDFNKSMDFWQQDKWMGKVPVKWHIVKDVPNSQFRHIVLENNDNKPVTNSRDTQEVPLRQGLEMLNIFKNFSMKTSILDDFQFYETRQKFMQEKRARQQSHPQHQQVLHNNKLDENHCQNDSSKTISHDLSGQLARSDKEGKVLKSSNGQEIPDSFKQLTATKGSQVDGAVENQDLSQERPVDSSKNTPKSIEK